MPEMTEQDSNAYVERTRELMEKIGLTPKEKIFTSRTAMNISMQLEEYMRSVSPTLGIGPKRSFELAGAILAIALSSHQQVEEHHKNDE